MKRIIIHWTAGKYYPTQYEKQFYHFLIDKDGKVFEGICVPEDNLDCTDGKYAAHTGGGNTASIGVSMCGMSGFYSRVNAGKYLITKVQFESCMNLCARLSLKYGIPVTKSSVMTHYEFGKANPKTSSFGKIDIVYLPCYPHVAKDDVGNFIRTKIRWYKDKNLRG